MEFYNILMPFLKFPMCYYPNDVFVDDVLKYGGFEKLVKNITIHLNEHKERYVWFQGRNKGISLNFR